MRISDWSSDVCSSDLVDAIVHVLRCFEGEVTHVEGSVAPLRDAETVETELMLADLDSAVKQRDAAVKRARGNDKDARDRLAILEPVIAALEAGRPARSVALREDQRPLFRQLQLLSAKPLLYAPNHDEDSAAPRTPHTTLCAPKA